MSKEEQFFVFQGWGVSSQGSLGWYCDWGHYTCAW